ncbi:MAG: succinate dehydrogenase iron-sulfur subunit [Candidatus Aminicenantes bacterium]|nr:succinate dehydrogenase iron-sulfur subunit [Candidatus Aminicenantes bacterium]NIM84967.1 succinate dehydrogenase iron-sulfur subunit [Candidatus Aminicenantes bacterium]NIN24481.1 succinate dehydrogenase iron-sulfur subunit [Candidatus Aminicenantes bacterium]NIN48245.1 succinate dehydrogenase iron-sulfur subunit [Candidatus Aminicenantes bacterium]NIN91148.1 succinate dehydrogenase iron-sulfur subunit [Candidatus Aminicenantes bacterium]
MEKVKANVKILRYQPETDKKPHWKTYEVEVEPDATILDVLNEIHWYHDGTLSYRRSCRSAICGSCAMKVNSRNVLACETPMSWFKNKLKIEPLPGLKIIKDLVVDWDDFFAKLERIKPYLIVDKPIPDKEFLQLPEEFEEIREAVTCILCAACTSSCPSLWGNENYHGPAALLKAYRFIFDSRDDGADERIDIINDRNGIWRCHTIFNCMEACPKDIKITEYLSKLKVKAAENSI